MFPKRRYILYIKKLDSSCLPTRESTKLAAAVLAGGEEHNVIKGNQWQRFLPSLFITQLRSIRFGDNECITSC